MPNEFDLYLISVEWESPNKVRHFTLSTFPLQPSSVAEGIYFYDTVIYNKVVGEYYQIALKTKEIPSFDSDELPWDSRLFRIPETYFWIIKGDWTVSSTNKRYHYCPSINTVGKIEFKIKGKKVIELDVNPNIDDFDFDALKDDFEGELWNLLTSNKSKAKIQTTEIKSGDKVFRFPSSASIDSFIKEFEKIVKNPKRELKYAVNNLLLNKVKPIPATFRKLVVAGSDVLLPSKSFVENFDNFENRYLSFMLYKIYQIVQYNSQFTAQQINRLDSEITNLKKNIEELKKPQIVNENVILEEIEKQKLKISEIERKWEGINKNLKFHPSAEYGKRTIKLIKRYASSYLGYNVNKKDSRCFFNFPNSILKDLENDKTYSFELSAKKIRDEDLIKGDYPIFEITNVKNIEAKELESEQNFLKSQNQKVMILSKNEWLLSSIQSPTEKNKSNEERKNQVLTLQKKIEKIEIQITSLSEYSSEIQQFKPQLSNLLNSDFVKKVNFKKIVRFQPSMTFLQNVQYRNALRYYQEILDSEGIDIEIFGLYEQITNYGVREMPQVYELWSLLSIIRVLEKDFGFKHNPNDLKSLIKNISPESKKIEEHIKIDFSGELQGRKIILHFQKKITGNKRPDFLLEILCGNRKIYVVLDSKFKNYNYKKSAILETKEMIDKYKVSSDYFVFILHPCKDLSGKKHTTKLTNLGGEDIYFDKDKISFPFHEFGYLMIKPNQIDNLKRLIGMSFEYLIESNHNAKQNDKIDPIPQHEMFCFSCGGKKVTKKQLNRDIRKEFPRFHYIYECENKECRHNVYIDYCWNCRTQLFKHGRYWDYHRTSVWSQFDIHCPSCGKTVADRPSITYDEH